MRRRPRSPSLSGLSGRTRGERRRPGLATRPPPPPARARSGRRRDREGQRPHRAERGGVLLEIAEDHGNDAGAPLRQNGGRRNGRRAGNSDSSAAIGVSATASPTISPPRGGAAASPCRPAQPPGSGVESSPAWTCPSTMPQALRRDDDGTPGVDAPDFAHGRSPSASATSSRQCRGSRAGRRPRLRAWPCIAGKPPPRLRRRRCERHRCDVGNPLACPGCR